jgi:hypothetical protein
MKSWMRSLPKSSPLPAEDNRTTEHREELSYISLRAVNWIRTRGPGMRSHKKNVAYVECLTIWPLHETEAFYGGKV